MRRGTKLIAQMRVVDQERTRRTNSDLQELVPDIYLSRTWPKKCQAPDK